jgi:hypothetical protein
MGTETPVIQPPGIGQNDTVPVRWKPILLIALVARIVVVLGAFHFSRVPPLTKWGFENIAIALSLHAGHGFSSPFFSETGPTAFMAPGYPLILAGIMGVFGTGSVAATAIVAVQEVFSLLTVILVVHVARLHFGGRAANYGGLLCALMPPLLTAPVRIWDTSLSALLLTAIFGAAAAGWLGRMRFVPAGAACAIAGLVNPALFPTLWAICGWAAWKAKTIPWAGVAAFLIVFSPWPIRNAVVMHSFISMRTDFGYELWIGNHPGADGNFVEAMNPMMSAHERQEFVLRGELGYLHEKGALAKSYIAAHPATFVQLSLKRAGQFWAGMEAGSGATTLPLTLIALAGLVMTWRRKSVAILYLLPLLIFPLPYYITHVYTRFQYVIDPLLAVLGGYAIAAFLGDSKARNVLETDEKVDTLAV